MRRCAVFGGYCVFWRYTAHYTQLTAKFLAGHTQARTSTHERVGTSGTKINGDGILTVHWVCSRQLFRTLQPTCRRFERVQNQSSSMLTSSSIEPEMNGLGRYHAVSRELFRTKTAYFCQLNTLKCVPFHLGIHYKTPNISEQVNFKDF